MYNDTDYALCFTCHNRDLLRYPTTSYATEFRDGDKNLHYVHANSKDRGNASELPKLMTDESPSGNGTFPCAR